MLPPHSHWFPCLWRILPLRLLQISLLEGDRAQWAAGGWKSDDNVCSCWVDERTTGRRALYHAGCPLILVSTLSPLRLLGFVSCYLVAMGYVVSVCDYAPMQSCRMQGRLLAGVCLLAKHTPQECLKLDQECCNGYREFLG